MKVGLLLNASEHGTFERLSRVFWRDLRVGKEVKKFFRQIEAELREINELRDGIIREYGVDGKLGVNSGNWEEGQKAVQDLYNQEVTFEKVPKMEIDSFATTEGFSIFDLNFFESIGLLASDEEDEQGDNTEVPVVEGTVVN